MILSLNDLFPLLPLTFLLLSALGLMLVDAWLPKKHENLLALLAALGITVSLGAVLASASEVARPAFGGMVVVDGFARFLDVVFLGSGIGGVALAYHYIQRNHIKRGEYYALLMLSISGMMLMTYANNLVIFFLALELLSIPLYVLAGMARPRLDSEEASLKYFLMGTFASGFVLYGIALIFGATGRLDLPGIVTLVSSGRVNLPLFLAGGGLLLVGIGFKMAAVPFHMWAPDVYQGAPSPVTAFMTIGAKAAAAAALLRVIVVAFPLVAATLTPILWTMAALTMITGNVLAVVQNNIKRLLAYSSIANGGYLLMALVPYGQQAVVKETVAAMIFYLASYAITILGAWAVIIALEQAEGKGLDLQDYAGLGRKHPWLALPMLLFMLSFTGIPPTLGFWGKFYLFRTAVDGGYLSLALVGLVTSLISAYYYLRVVVIMYMQPGEPQAQTDPWVRLTAAAAALVVLVLSLIPGPLFEIAARAMISY